MEENKSLNDVEPKMEEKILNASDILGGQYLTVELAKSMELIGIVLEIEKAGSEIIKEVPKLYITFKDISGIKLILNRANGKILMEEFGDPLVNWIDKKIKLDVIKVPYMGKMVDSLSLSTIQ